ncbi:MAG: GNAT family N-acetyltransferase [Myxococcota bacterium]|nr:GNAT family N-acetyltransferase [Myxococcota bacterium]
MRDVELRWMRPEEREAVLDLLEGAFGERELFAAYLDFDPELGPEDSLLALAEGEPVACVQIFTKRIRLRGETVGLGGIGSVATQSKWRQQGLASRLLQQAIAEMRQRGMALSLLFAGPLPLYERQGWVSIPGRYLRIHSPDEIPGLPETCTVRDFDPRDLAAVRELYERCAGSLETTTCRTPKYWEGQLRYAGNPNEDFRVAARDGQIIAYARAMGSPDARGLLEYACEDGAEVELGGLLLRLAAKGHPLIGPAGPIDGTLRKLGARAEAFRPVSAMWRVLDRTRLEQLAGVGGDEARILETLVDRPDAVYWPSDRF